MPGKVYVDDNDCKVFVCYGISAGTDWMTVRQKGRNGTHRVKAPALPIRHTPEEAQADLDRYAAEKGWEAISA